jgi:FemAB family protein
VSVLVDQQLCSVEAAVLEALHVQGITAHLRASASATWREVASGLSYQPVDYSLAMIDYQLSYWTGNGRPSRDVSLILEHDRQPCGVWPLSVSCDADGIIRLGSNGGPVLPPLFVSKLARKSVKSLAASCFVAIQSLCGQLGQARIESVESFADSQGLSAWHDCFMTDGGKAELRHDLFVDLSGSMADIKSVFRKSNKALVSAGSKMWDVQVVSKADPLQWDEFRQLHLAVAGRATRAEESWHLQHAAVTAGDAFFVRLRDQAGRMVGAGLFHVTRDEGLYAVGAYDRALFDKPLGHVVQYHAIEEMKRRGLRWYKLGARAYPSDEPAPTDKEMTISDFKQGFASHLLPRYGLRHEQTST